MIRRPRPGARPGGPWGFTLLELLVAIGLFALFTLTLSRLLMGGMQTFQRGQALSSLRSDMRSALDLISADFRQSTLNVVTPAYASGKTRSLVLTFTRAAYSSSGPTTHSITYTIDPTTNTLTRYDSATNQTVTVAENVLVGARLGESDSPALYRSYFVWSINPNVDTGRDYATMEVRLTGFKYRGKQEQRMSLVTQVSQRISKGTESKTALTLSVPSDLGRPAPGRAPASSTGLGW